jgi:hypothetical protein
MTIQEYQQTIEYINKCAAYSHIGLSKVYNTSEVEEIIQRHNDVRFTYQLTAQNLQMNVS